jgi:hypothetical protein
MPGKNVCDKIKDPKEKQKCLNYQGKYAGSKKKVSKNPVKGSMKRGY